MDVLVLPNVLDEDLKASFARHSDEGLLSFKDIGAVLTTTYKGETPNLKSETMAIASKVTSDSVTWEEFIGAVNEVRGMYESISMYRSIERELYCTRGEWRDLHIARGRSC